MDFISATSLNSYSLGFGGDCARWHPDGAKVTQKQEHSRKPHQVYDLIERCSPGPFVELFARNPRRGWTQWGDEVPTNGDLRKLHPLSFIVQPDEPGWFGEQRVLPGVG